MNRYINIEFASSKLMAKDRFNDICEASAFAALNLRARFNIELHRPIVVDGRVWLPVICESPLDNLGHRLKGIANYLLNKTDGSFDYSKYRIGNRLLFYEEYANIPAGAGSNNVTYRVMTIKEIEKELGYKIKIVSE